ncbi:MAG: FAD-dependent oxidoreductase [Acidobacteriota bacterium]
MAKRVLVVGGNAAGMTAASRAKRLQPELDITILEAGPFISYSICGLPYYIAGMVERHEDLLTFTPEKLESERGIKALTGVRAEEVRPGRRSLLCTEVETNREFELDYDLLILSTGYRPRVPSMEGLELEGVWTVSRLEDGIRIQEAAGFGSRVAIVGGGYVGLMMAHGLGRRGLEVTVFERNRHLFGQVDEDMAEVIEEELRSNGVRLMLDAPVRRLVGRNGVFEGVEMGRETYPADLALIDVGIVPNTELAERSGIGLGLSGGIQVDGRGQTALPAVYAAGNCAETRHLVSGRPIFSALGTTAAQQGRVVGENVAGRRSFFPGSLETSIEKVFSLGVSRTGLTLRQALDQGFEASCAQVTGRERAGYYPDCGPMRVKLIFERPNGRLLGGQIVAGHSAAKRIDTLVAALTAGMTLRDLSQLNLAYAPPFGTLWDPLQIAANVGRRELERW